jgi:transposase
MESHNYAIRRKAYDMWLAKEKKSRISQELGVDYDTVLIWVKRFSAEGEQGLQPRYDRCGRKSVVNDPVRARALALRDQHEEWGAEYIRLELSRQLPEKHLVQPNQIRRWLVNAGKSKPKTKLPGGPSDWARKAFERVQVDAKERLETLDGQPCCYLNYIDEYTGAALDAFVFPLCSYQPGSFGRCF